MLSHYMDFVWTLIVWSQNWPAMFWEYSKPTTIGFGVAEGSMQYDFFQGMFLTVFLGFVGAIVEIPCELFGQFMIADSHGFNK